MRAAFKKFVFVGALRANLEKDNRRTYGGVFLPKSWFLPPIVLATHTPKANFIFSSFCRSFIGRFNFSQFLRQGRNRTTFQRQKTSFAIVSTSALPQLLLFIRFTTKVVMTSFSCGRLSAIISVRATKALSARRLEPSAL